MIAVTTLELTLRMLVALGVILGLLAGCNLLLRRYHGVRGGSQAPIRVRAQQRLDKHATVHLVEAGDRRVLVGTTTGSIVVLADGLDLVAEEPAADTSAPADRSAAADGPEEASAPWLTRAIDLRAANPVRSLQNKTVRRR
jgi:flagellar biogenesis protein FliO